MNKKKLRCLVDIGMNLPRAGLEVVLLGSMPVGVATATIGAGTVYLLGHPDIAKGLLLGGFSGAVAGLSLSAVYSMLTAQCGEFGFIEDFDYAIDNICEDVKRYKQAGK